MKTKIIGIVTLVAVVMSIAVLARNQIQKPKGYELTVEPMGDGKGIFIGNKKQITEPQQPSQIHPKLLREQQEHDRAVKAIHEAANYERMGDESRRAGDLKSAAMYYEKAYLTDRGSRGVTGFLLAQAYEELGQYGKAVEVLDEMMKDRILSEHGIQKANDMKARLLTAKNQQKP